MAVFMRDGVTMETATNDQVAAFRNAGWKEVSPAHAPRREQPGDVDASGLTPEGLDALEWPQMLAAAKQMGISAQNRKKEDLKAAILERLAAKEAGDGQRY